MGEPKNKKRKFNALTSKNKTKIQKEIEKLEKDYEELKNKYIQLQLEFIDVFDKKELYSLELHSFLNRFFPEDNNQIFGNFYELMKSETNFFQANEEKLKKLCPSKYKKYKNIKKESIKLI